MAPSCSVPAGSPSASRTILPFAGSAVVRSIPDMARARELAHATWPSSLSKKAGRSGTMASRRLRCGSPRGNAGSDHPLPWIHSRSGCAAAWAAIAWRYAAASVRSWRSQLRESMPPSIGWTCASWNPGSSVSPSSSITRVAGPIRGRTSAELPTKTIRPSRAATASAAPASSVIVSTVAPRKTRSGRSLELMPDRS